MIGGELLLKVSLVRGRLEVFVQHARGLHRLATGQPPNPYVKCYLRRGTERAQKRKTRVLVRTCVPTFNDIVSGSCSLTPSQLLYQSPQPLSAHQLEATVWHCEALNPNVYMGGVLVDLGRLEQTDCVEEWKPLVDVFAL